MKNNADKPTMYIRKNREEDVIIFLKENDQKAAQRLLCHMRCVDRKYNILGETTNIESVEHCDVLLVASASVLTRDRKEYEKIQRELNKKGIKIEVAGSNGKIGDYIEAMLKLSKKRMI